MCFDSCIASPEESAQKAKSSEIDKMIVSERKTEEKIVKLLLLGSSESGKSTFIKQLRIIYGAGFDENDRVEFVAVIRSNLLQATKSILAAMTILYIEFDTQEAAGESKKMIQLLNDGAAEMAGVEGIQISADNLGAVSKSIQTLWQDEGFKQCFRRSKEYQLIDSAKYYLDKAAEILSPDFHPSEQDILRSRTITTSVVEHMLDQDIRRLKYQVIDVSGQPHRNGRRNKWMFCFDDVECIIFFASLSDYDLKVEGSETKNRMQESLDLFETILRLPWFKRKTTILFLNKTDLFAEKIQHSNIVDHFPEYKGEPGNVEQGKKFILSMYEKRNPQLSPHVNYNNFIFSHYTCATDTHNIKLVFRAVLDIVHRTVCFTGVLL